VGIFLLGLIAAAAILTAACVENDRTANEPSLEPQRGGVAVLGSITDMDSWNEYISRQSFANYVLRRIYLRLAVEQKQEAGSPEVYAPMLAERWEQSADGLSIKFHLREAVWSDGTPITAEDVRFTWQAQTSPDVPWANAKIKSGIVDVEIVDPRTVTFRFERPNPYQFADAVDGGILPRHVFGEVPFEEWASHDWSRYKIGSGPFLLERHEPGHEIVLQRNPRYHDTEYPLLDRVVIRIVPDVLSLLTQLETGEIDFMLGVPPRNAYRIAANSSSSIQILPFKIPRFEYLGSNCERPPLDDPKFRRGITLAIDRQALVEDLVYGFGTVSSRPVPSNWWGAAEDLEPWPYDPDGARRILAARGYAAVGADGARISDGPTFELDLMTNAGNQLREDSLVKIQEQLQRVGVKVNIRTMEQRSLIQRASKGDYDGYLGGWNFVGKIPLDALFKSDAVPPNGFNVVRYRSAALDSVLDELDRATDANGMKPLLVDVQRRIHEDQPYTFLFERDGLAAHGPRLQGVEIGVPQDPLTGLERFWVASR
jgi:peptide/nickel transport system substrate-binding protein